MSTMENRSKVPSGFGSVSTVPPPFVVTVPEAGAPNTLDCTSFAEIVKAEYLSGLTQVAAPALRGSTFRLDHAPSALVSAPTTPAMVINTDTKIRQMRFMSDSFLFLSNQRCWRIKSCGQSPHRWLRGT